MIKRACRLRWRLPALVAAVLVATPAYAQGSGIEVVIGRAGVQIGGGALVDLRLLNPGAAAGTLDLPDRVEAQIATADGASRAIWLERAADTPTSLTIPAGGFVSAHYRLSAVDATSGALLSIARWSSQQVALTPALATPAEQMAASSPAPVTPPATDRSVGNAFLDNLSAYDPIYAVYGPGTNTDARIQISFKYQLYGSRARESRHASIRDGLYFAYTQRMFWDLGASSSPFRNVDYQPELFYLSQPLALSDRATLSGQIGLRHESNGRAGAASRSINMAYVAPMGAFSLGDGWRLSVAPRLWLYVGDRSDNPDIRRYRGNSGLFLEIGQEDGPRLSTSSRFNIDSGKGAISADISYPLRSLLGGGPDFYLFGQSFHGYGENLLDYNRRITRFRIGVALVR
ncbi:phospholipase [Sphingomonas montanisoli]|uniref:Phospholipase A1 n=2 Tax=Sphingomonas montanisoli TaxID=2606412 RepID=A0A5D9CHZ2_9SPHN|nr:phospholipase [Sphingomonas montanisoli]